MILWEDLLQTEKDKLAAVPELQETDKLFWAELGKIEEISWSMPTPTASSLWEKSPVRYSKTEQQKRKGDTEQESLRAFKKPRVTPFVQNAAILLECCLDPWISSSKQDKHVSVSSEDADLLIRLKRPPVHEQERMGDFREPLETRFLQNAAVLPECCIGPHISSPGQETLISAASHAPELIIHGRSVAEYQQLYHSVLDVLVKRKEHLSRSKKIKKRLWAELSGPRFCSTALSDTQPQLTQSFTGPEYTFRKEFTYLTFYN